ncbi:MAG: hypothetical protein Q8K63_08320 [Acidimicrobiales bacterium]|nr:hypothetical protein [Acidimicrobiales bacterium]
MNPIIKLALFAVVLVAMFAGGAAVGAVTHPDRSPAPSSVHSTP